MGFEDCGHPRGKDQPRVASETSTFQNRRAVDIAVARAEVTAILIVNTGDGWIETEGP